MHTKQCLQCGVEMERVYGTTQRHWDTKRFCSSPCRTKYNNEQRRQQLNQRKLTIAEPLPPAKRITCICGKRLYEDQALYATALDLYACSQECLNRQTGVVAV